MELLITHRHLRHDKLLQLDTVFFVKGHKPKMLRTTDLTYNNAVYFISLLCFHIKYFFSETGTLVQFITQEFEHYCL